MEEIIVYGDNPLKGTVEIEGAKNAVLPILAASLLAEEGTTKFNSVPILSDVFTMKEVIHHLNAKVDFDLDKKEITVDASYPLEIEAPYEYVSDLSCHSNLISLCQLIRHEIVHAVDKFQAYFINDHNILNGVMDFL